MALGLTDKSNIEGFLYCTDKSNREGLLVLRYYRFYLKYINSLYWKEGWGKSGSFQGLGGLGVVIFCRLHTKARS